MSRLEECSGSQWPVNVDGWSERCDQGLWWGTAVRPSDVECSEAERLAEELGNWPNKCLGKDPVVLLTRYPEAYYALPKCYQADHALEFWTTGTGQLVAIYLLDNTETVFDGLAWVNRF